MKISTNIFEINIEKGYQNKTVIVKGDFIFLEKKCEFCKTSIIMCYSNKIDKLFKHVGIEGIFHLRTLFTLELTFRCKNG